MMAVQSSGLRMENEGESEGRPRMLGFGFPFSPEKRSPFTGLSIGPGVVSSLLDGVGSDLVLFSRSAGHYSSDDRIVGVNWNRSIGTSEGPASSIAALGDEDYALLAPYETLLIEMMGRRNWQLEKDSDGPSFAAFEQRRMDLRNRMAYWSNLIEDRSIAAYVNSNCPHLLDDVIAYLLVKGKGLPAAFPYRLPIVPGVSARLYLPAGLFDHQSVHGADGGLVGPEDIPESEAMAPLPSDLAMIYRKVVRGPLTLGDLSREALAERGVTRPAQFTRQFIDPRVRGGLGWMAARIGPRRQKARVMRQLLTVEGANRKSLESLTSKTRLPSNFIYFPLHMQPEASTNPLGGVFSEQLRAVRLIAEYLPPGWRLAVKEHPHQQLALRPEGWYRALASTPGVTLVSPQMDSFALQRECRAVATVTGAAAWEAWFKGKPAIVFGHILYQSAPAIFPVRTRTDARDALKAIEQGRHPEVREIRRYLGCLAHMSFPGHLDAYIDPCLPTESLDPEENEREIGRRLARALEYQASHGLHASTNQKVRSE